MTIAGARTRQMRQLARENWDVDGLRPGKEEAIKAIVVSPLIAIQRDQVEAITSAGIGGGAELNSTLIDEDRAATLEGFKREEIEFLFLAPEQLLSDETVAEVAVVAPSLFVVGEPACRASGSTVCGMVRHTCCSRRASTPTSLWTYSVT